MQNPTCSYPGLKNAILCVLKAHPDQDVAVGLVAELIYRKYPDDSMSEINYKNNDPDECILKLTSKVLDHRYSLGIEYSEFSFPMRYGNNGNHHYSFRWSTGNYYLVPVYGSPYAHMGPVYMPVPK